MQITIPWQEVDTLLLDLDGTLLDLHYDNYFWLHHLPRRLAELTDQTEDWWRDHLHLSYDQMKGTLDWYCLAYWQDRLQVDIMELKREVVHKVELRPDAERFLQWMKRHNKRLLLVTNGHRWGLDMKLSLTGIDVHFDEIISSHDYRAPKETQEFWQELSRQHRFDPERSLFVDDNESVLQSASQYGIRYLIHILQPDMQQAGNPAAEFPAIHHFAELLPDD